MKIQPGWLQKQLNESAERAADMPHWMTRTETVLEQSEKLDGTIVQTVQRQDGLEYQREVGLTMLELLILAGYDASLPHPECFRDFSYLKLAEILNVRTTAP